MATTSDFASSFQPRRDITETPQQKRVLHSGPAILSRFGILDTTVLISLPIIFISGTITLTTVLLMGHPLIPDMFLGLGIPVLLGPPVAYMVARFRLLYAEAESASKTKSDFLSHMSHDLESPLHGIIGLTQVLLEDEEFRKQYGHEISAIHTSGQHLLEMIDDILNYGRLEAGVLEGYEENFDLSAMLQKLFCLFKVRCECKGLLLSLEIPSDLPMYVRGDQRKLLQVLVNLVGNALKFTNEGSIRLVVRGEQGQFTFRVKDTGPGIPPEEQEQIFKPFTHAGQDTFYQGTGLGLAISRRYAELMGGTLTVQSQVGSGSDFMLSVPLTPIYEETYQKTRDAG